MAEALPLSHPGTSVASDPDRRAYAQPNCGLDVGNLGGRARRRAIAQHGRRDDVLWRPLVQMKEHMNGCMNMMSMMQKMHQK